MKEEAGEVMEIEPVDMIPFSFQSSQGYQVERLERFMSSTERVGRRVRSLFVQLMMINMKPYAGHNRARAMGSIRE